MNANTRKLLAATAAFAKTKKLLAMTCAAAFSLGATAATFTSASYAQREHLLIQWDGIDNAGTGAHNPSATTWKNIAPNATAYDLTLTGNGAWSGDKALSVNGTSATYAAGAAPSCKTIEVVFKMSENKASLLLYGGNQTTRQLVAFSASGTTAKCYCEGLSGVAHPTVNWAFDADVLRSVAATFDNPGQIASAMFADGVARTDDSHTNGWTLATQKIVIGAYGDERYPWVGEVYAVRMYDCVLTADEIAANHAIDVARFGEWKPTSDDYVQDGLVAQWDGIDNAGTGAHNPSATIWKNLASTGSAYDLTLTANGSWNAEGNALAVSNLSAVGQTAAPEYKTMEVIFKPKGSGRILFSSGDQKRVVIFDNDSIAYFSGAVAKGNAGGVTTKSIQENFLSGEVKFLAAEYDDGGAVANVFKDATRREDGGYQNSWNASGVISIGNRDNSVADNYLWFGDVYAIRLYTNRLTKAQLARNHLIDCKRFLTSSSYVRRNLVGYWDGIDNVGTGVHNPTHQHLEEPCQQRQQIRHDRWHRRMDGHRSSVPGEGADGLSCRASRKRNRGADFQRLRDRVREQSQWDEIDGCILRRRREVFRSRHFVCHVEERRMDYGNQQQDGRDDFSCLALRSGTRQGVGEWRANPV